MKCCLCTHDFEVIDETTICLRCYISIRYTPAVLAEIENMIKIHHQCNCLMHGEICNGKVDWEKTLEDIVKEHL